MENKECVRLEQRALFHWEAPYARETRLAAPLVEDSAIPRLLVQVNSLIDADARLATNDPLMEDAGLERAHAELNRQEAGFNLVALLADALVELQNHVIGPATLMVERMRAVSAVVAHDLLEIVNLSRSEVVSKAERLVKVGRVHELNRLTEVLARCAILTHAIEDTYVKLVVALLIY